MKFIDTLSSLVALSPQIRMISSLGVLERRYDNPNIIHVIYFYRTVMSGSFLAEIC